MDKDEMRMPLSGQPAKDPVDRAVAKMVRGDDEPDAGGVEVVATAEAAKRREQQLEEAAAQARGAQTEAQAQSAEAVRRAEGAKRRLSESVAGIAGLLHEAGMHLQSQDQAALARMLHQAAEGLDQLQGALRERELEELLAQARSYARERPAVIVGGSLLAGFVLARLLSPRRH